MDRTPVVPFYIFFPDSMCDSVPQPSQLLPDLPSTYLLPATPVLPPYLTDRCTYPTISCSHYTGLSHSYMNNE